MSREWMCDIRDAFAAMAKNDRANAINALNQARADATTATHRLTHAPLGITPLTMPPTATANYTDNRSFKRISRAFTYLCVDTLYAMGVRASATYQAMVLAVTNVRVPFPHDTVSNIMATTALQRAIKARVSAWTGAKPKYSTDMTTQQLYTFLCRFVDYLVRYNKANGGQLRLDGKPCPGMPEPVELEVLMEQMEDMYPGMEPLDMGKEVDLAAPAIDQVEQIEGQAVLSLFMDEKGRLGIRHKRRRSVDGQEEVTNILVDRETVGPVLPTATDSESEPC